MPSADEIAELRAFAGELADAARGVILPFFRAPHAVESKQARAHDPDGYDPVTEADKGAERAMRALIEARYPDHGILGEEFDAKAARGGYTWILDPIDGTRAFISGLPLWGVLIALAYEGKPIIGVIDQPYIGERFSGWPGGAELSARGGVRPLRVRDCAALSDAKLATTDQRLFRGSEDHAFSAVRDAVRLTRYGCDCYAYAMVALGGLDIVIESGLAPWDVAALAPVLEGAGGLLTDWRGRPIHESANLLDKTTRVQALATGDARVRAAALTLLAQG